LHFTPGSAGELADTLNWVWSNPQQIRAMGREARQDYENKYSAEINYQALMAIYQQVIASTN
jgi:glycosyltransferase involved in cell wall biosynthesis